METFHVPEAPVTDLYSEALRTAMSTGAITSGVNVHVAHKTQLATKTLLLGNLARSLGYVPPNQFSGPPVPFSQKPPARLVQMAERSGGWGNACRSIKDNIAAIGEEGGVAFAGPIPDELTGDQAAHVRGVTLLFQVQKSMQRSACELAEANLGGVAFLLHWHATVRVASLLLFSQRLTRLSSATPLCPTPLKTFCKIFKPLPRAWAFRQ